MARGLLIALEGVDGAGSTTQTRLLTDFLRQSGHRVIATKEPTSGRVGRLIREYLRSSVSHPGVDALLFAADRIEHLEMVVKPALGRGEHVICDRYLDSSLAYQAAEGVETEWLETLNKFALKPDHIIILDVDPTTSLNRKHVPVWERFETVEFLNKVRQNFMTRASSHGYAVVDASRTLMQVHEAVKQIVLQRIEASK